MKFAVVFVTLCLILAVGHSAEATRKFLQLVPIVQQPTYQEANATLMAPDNNNNSLVLYNFLADQSGVRLLIDYWPNMTSNAAVRFIARLDGLLETFNNAGSSNQDQSLFGQDATFTSYKFAKWDPIQRSNLTNSKNATVYFNATSVDKLVNVTVWVLKLPIVFFPANKTYMFNPNSIMFNISVNLTNSCNNQQNNNTSGSNSTSNSNCTANSNSTSNSTSDSNCTGSSVVPNNSTNSSCDNVIPPNSFLALRVLINATTVNSIAVNQSCQSSNTTGLDNQTESCMYNNAQDTSPPSNNSTSNSSSSTNSSALVPFEIADPTSIINVILWKPYAMVDGTKANILASPVFPCDVNSESNSSICEIFYLTVRAQNPKIINYARLTQRKLFSHSSAAVSTGFDLKVIALALLCLFAVFAYL